ncbi:hypothetical protein MHTCC0001_07270 [Flavobacteriaceae bacterium MHTCC 0001]
MLPELLLLLEYELELEFLLIGAAYLLEDDDLLVEYEGCLVALLRTVEFLFIVVGELERLMVDVEPL